MSVTSGFFNSLNGDRKYNARQMSQLFDGIINDGVFSNIGTSFGIKAATGLGITVGIGRAWFNSTWINNDAILPLELSDADLLLDRIDAVVIEVDTTDAVRNGTIKIVTGTPASSPKTPTLTKSEKVNQYPLAYISRKASSTSISQANITNKIGTSDCPYITGILQVQNIDNIVAQWGAQWIDWFTTETAKSEAEAEEMRSEWYAWFSSTTSEHEQEASSWMAQMKSDFIEWFSTLEIILGEDVATSLANEIVNLQENFATLLREACVYDYVRDSDGAAIEDSYGSTIEAKVLLLAETEGYFEDHVKNTNNPHNVTIEQIGAADVNHTHDDYDAHLEDKDNPHDVTAAQIGLGNVNNTADNAKNVLSATKLTTARTIAISGGATGTATSFNGTKNISIPVTALNPTKMSSGTLPSGVKATNSTDYATSRLRNIRASTTDLTAGTSTLSNGEIYLVYE